MKCCQYHMEGGHLDNCCRGDLKLVPVAGSLAKDEDFILGFMDIRDCVERH